MTFGEWAASSWTGWMLLALLVVGWAAFCAFEFSKKGKWRHWWMLGCWPLIISIVYIVLANAVWVGHFIKAAVGLI